MSLTLIAEIGLGYLLGCVFRVVLSAAMGIFAMKRKRKVGLKRLAQLEQMYAGTNAEGKKA
jgi:hypothetical protein